MNITYIATRGFQSEGGAIVNEFTVKTYVYMQCINNKPMIIE